MEKKIIIAIDGFSSCGKSTLAKAMAKALEYVFVDTGAMYRAIALYFLRNDIAFNDDVAIRNALEDIELRFKFNPLSQKSDMYLNGENVEQEIRAMRVSQKVIEVGNNKISPVIDITSTIIDSDRIVVLISLKVILDFNGIIITIVQ